MYNYIQIAYSDKKDNLETQEQEHSNLSHGISSVFESFFAYMTPEHNFGIFVFLQHVSAQRSSTGVGDLALWTRVDLGRLHLQDVFNRICIDRKGEVLQCFGPVKGIT